LEAPPPLAFGTAELVFGKQFSETRTGDYYEDDPPIRWPNRRTVFRATTAHSIRSISPAFAFMLGLRQWRLRSVQGAGVVQDNSGD